MRISITQADRLGTAALVAQDPEIANLIATAQAGIEKPIGNGDDIKLRSVVNAKIPSSKLAWKTVERLALTGNAAPIVEAYKAVERVANDSTRYLPILKAHVFNFSLDPRLGDRIDYRRLENAYTLAKEGRALMTGGDKIVWDGAFSLAKKHYSAPVTQRDLVVFPFVLNSEGRYFFEFTGAKKTPGQQKFAEGLMFEKEQLVVGDFGQMLGGLMLDLLDQGHPNANVPGKVSRVFLDNGETNDPDRLAALLRNQFGVGDDYNFDNPIDCYFVGLSLESQK